jgi:hypothetical protein
MRGRRRIITTFFVEGCTSPIGLCTEGTIPYGLLAGTTRFTVLALDPGDSADLLLYTGALVITTSRGVLTIQDRGVLNATNGNFFEIDQIVAGTGAFTNGTGTLFAWGTSTPTSFAGRIFGWICGLPEDESEDDSYDLATEGLSPDVTVNGKSVAEVLAAGPTG